MRHIYALVFLFYTSLGFGQSIFTSIGGGGDWAISGNWSENNQGNPSDSDGIPDEDDEVIITNGSPISITTSVEVLNININAFALLTNNGTLRVLGNIIGSGQFTNGTSSSLTLLDNGTYSVSTMSLSATGNSVIYAGSVNGDILPGPYYDLQINMDVSSNVSEIDGNNVVVNNNLTVSSGILKLNSANTLTISGDILVETNGEFEINVNGCQVDVVGDLTVEGGVFDQNEGTANINGNFTVNGGILNITDDDSVLDVNGVFQVSGGSNSIINGTFTPGDIIVDESEQLSLAGIDLTVLGTTSINGTLTINGTTGIKTINNLTLEGLGILDFDVNETISVSGDLTMSGLSRITGNSNSQVLNIAGDFNNTGGTASINGIQFNVTGTTTIDGTLSFPTTVGEKSFGNVTLNASGTWDNSLVSQGFTFSGNLINNGGVWNGCPTTTGCPYTMTSATGTISGNGTFNVTDFTINSPASITNNGNVILTDDLTGTGTFINGASGTLTLSENGSYTINTLTLNSLGNTVIYDGSIADVILPGPFYDLQINMDAATTDMLVIHNDVIVDNDLTVTSGNLRISSAHSLTVSGDMVIESNGELELNVNGSMVDVTGDFNLNGGIYDQNEGTINVNGNFNINSGTFYVTDDDSVFDVDGLFQVSGGTNTVLNGSFNAGGITVDVNQAISFAGINLTAGGTTTINGLIKINGVTGDKSVNDIVLGASGNLDFEVNETFSIGGDLSMSGASSISGNSNSQVVNVAGEFNIPSGTASINGVQFNVTGGTTIDGTLSFPTTIGSKSFGDVTLNASGTWDNASVSQGFTFGGSLVNNGGSWNGCATTTGCPYTMTSETGTLSGAGTFNITDLVINTPASITNNANVVLTDDLIGTGTFVNGATGTLTLEENGSYSISTLMLNTVGNIVIYDGSVNEVMLPGPYYDLRINMDLASILCEVKGGDVTVNNNLTITSGDLEISTANTLLVMGELLIDTNGEFQPNTIGSITNITGGITINGGTYNHDQGTVTVGSDFTNTGGIVSLDNSSSSITITGNYISNGAGASNDFNEGELSMVDLTLNTGGIINIGSLKFTSTGSVTIDNGTLTVDGDAGDYNFNNISVASSGIWNVTSAYDPTINGNLFNDGSFTGCNGTGTGCDYNLTSTSGTISGSGAMNFMSDIILNDGASYTNTNSGGFNVTDGLETTSGAGTFINGTNGVLSYGGTTGNMSITNFTASANPNTVIYNRTASNQLIEPSTDGFYHNLIINKADGIDATTGEIFTINGSLTLTSGDLIMGAQNLIIGETGSISGGGTTSYIQQSGGGRLLKNYPTSSFSDPLSIPFGDATRYAPMAFTLNAGTNVDPSARITFEYNNATGHPSRNNNNTASGGDDDGTPATDYLNDYWEFSTNNISNINFDASIDYSDGENVVGGAESNMVPVILREATPPGEASSTLDWHIVGLNPNKGNGSINFTSDVVTFTEIRNVLNDLTTWVLYAMDNGSTRLPITLISFDAVQVENHVELNWATADEVNNEFFTIERSTNGFDFQPILTVAGAGNSEVRLEYSAIDPAPIEGRGYYRLKQTDFNGQFAYSEIEAIEFVPNNELDEMGVYPNPLNRGASIKLTGAGILESDGATYTLYTNAGEIVKSGAAIDILAGEIRLEKTGLYLLKINHSQGKETIKILVH